MFITLLVRLLESSRRRPPPALRLALLAAVVFHPAPWSWGQEGAIPPVEADRILDKTAGTQAEVTILSATKAQIRVQRGQDRQQQEMLGRDRYEIVHWDGVTNADAIVKACELRRQGLVRMFEEAVWQEDPDRVKQLTEEVTAEQDVIRGALDRVLRLPDETSAARRQAKIMAAEVDQLSALEASHRQRIFQFLVNRLAPLNAVLQNEEFDKLPEVCRAMEKDLQGFLEQVQTPTDADRARSLTDRMKTVCGGLRTAAAKFKPLPGKVPPEQVSDLPRLRDELLQQHEALWSLGPTAWLGPLIDAWCTRRAQRVEELGRHIQRLVQLTGVAARLPPGLAAAKEKLEKDEPDWDAAEREYAALESGLAEQERRLRKEQSDDDVRYALDETLKAVKTLQTARRGTELQVLRKVGEKSAAEATSAQGPEGALKCAAKLQGLAQRLEGLPKTDYEDQARAQIESLLQQLREAQFKCAVKLADASTRYVRDELQRISSRLTAAEMAKNCAAQHEAWNKCLDKAQLDLDQAKQLANNPLLSSLSASTFRQLEEARKDLNCLGALMRIQQALAKLPRNWANLKDWGTSDAALAAVEEEAQAVSGECPHSLAKSCRETLGDLAGVREFLTAAKPRLQFEDEAGQLETHLGTAAETLEKRSLAQARRHYRAAQFSLARLDELITRHPQLVEDAKSAACLKEDRRRGRELAARIDLLVAELRRAAGWQPLPAATTLAAPTPENSLLRLELLLGDGRLADAQAELRLFVAANPQPDWRARVPALQVRLDFQSAQACEAGGKTAEARQLYEQLAAAQANPTIAAAAHSALLRLAAREQRLLRDRQAQTRAVILACLLAAGLGVALFAAWRASARQRLQRTRRHLAAAESAAVQGDFAARDRYLRLVARTLATFADDHPEAVRVRAQITRREAIGDALVPPRPVAVLGVDLVSDVEELLAAGAALEGVPGSLAWLRQDAGQEAAQDRRARLLKTLAERLKPSPQMPPHELQERAAYAEQLWQLVPQLTWPGLYAAAARWWLGDAAGAQDLAESLPAAADQIQGPPQLRLVLGICWWRAGRVPAAVGLLRQLRQDPATRSQATTWLRIIRAARQATKRGDRQESVAKLIAGLFR